MSNCIQVDIPDPVSEKKMSDWSDPHRVTSPAMNRYKVLKMVTEIGPLLLPVAFYE